jgi:bifunctional non-homologous end joining protein LigD
VSDRLASYRHKRDFGETPEPAGQQRGGDGQPRFVVQEHHATRLHWDLRLEHDGTLASWAIPNGIPEEPKQNRKAVRTEDHPLEYLEFHGEIPKGSYGAGTMTIWDSGTYEVHKWEDRKVEVTFHGQRLKGRYALFATDRGNGPPKDWMIHRMDPPADPEAEPMPERVAPMLATLGPLPPDDGRWAFEIKWDGVRAIALSEPGRLRFHSRNLNDITPRYPELSKLNRALSSHRAVLDGEIVAFDAEGRPSFSALQGRMHLTSESQVRRLAKSQPVSYVIFDLLWLDGHSLMREPYERRRARLAELDLNGDRWQTPEHVVGHGAEVLEASRAQGLEGIIAKRLESPYEPGRRARGWVKVKNVQREDVIIGGWQPGEGRRRDRIGSLLVGLPDGEGGLRYVGKVGTGFTEAELDRLAKLLTPLETDRNPFSDTKGLPRGAVFVKPVLQCTVEFSEWTKDARLRAPSYKGLVPGTGPVMASARPVGKGKDKAVEVEVPGPPTRTVRITNPDKVLWPKTGTTKAELIDYFAAMAPTLLPHLEGRMLTLKRYPNGVEGQFFYEKQCPAHRPEWVQTHTVSLERKKIDFCLANNLPTLIWLAQLADIELHSSLALAETPERPTMMVFDLDPGPPATIVECSEVGLWLQGMFEHLGLESHAKTSGSKGLQVYVPLNGDVTYDDTKPFSKAVAEMLEAEAPDRVVSRQKKELRGGKVLVDWSQNDEHKTTVNVYSPRARERPTVSTPVTWDEVRGCAEGGDPEALAFTMDDVLRRVASEGDLFGPVLSVAQKLPEL